MKNGYNKRQSAKKVKGIKKWQKFYIFKKFFVSQKLGKNFELVT